MTTNKYDPWELLHEARESLMDLKDPYSRCGCPDCTPATKDTLLSRIDAALAARDAGMNCGKGCPDCGHPYGGLDYCQGEGHNEL